MVRQKKTASWGGILSSLKHLSKIWGTGTRRMLQKNHLLWGSLYLYHVINCHFRSFVFNVDMNNETYQLNPYSLNTKFRNIFNYSYFYLGILYKFIFLWIDSLKIELTVVLTRVDVPWPSCVFRNLFIVVSMIILKSHWKIQASKSLVESL